LSGTFTQNRIFNRWMGFIFTPGEIAATIGGISLLASFARNATAASLTIYCFEFVLGE
jgi:hypothetical protein